MAFKEVILPDIGTVKLYKRRGTRSIRLSIGSSNDIRVSLPVWAPYKSGLDFVKSHQDWLATHQRLKLIIKHGHKIADGTVIYFKNDQRARAARVRTSGAIITVTLPLGQSSDHLSAQQAAHRAALRVLRRYAEELLIPRLRGVAQQHDFSYGSISVKHLKSRWGSCNHNRDIVLNSYLVQLPPGLIAYVLLHELAHTRYLAHNAAFWRQVSELYPDYIAAKRELRTYRPELMLSTDS